MTEQAMVAVAPKPEPEQMIMVAIEHGAPIEVIERLYALAKDATRDRQRAAYHAALAGFQGEVPPIPKRHTATIDSQRTGGHYTYTYAKLADIQQIIGPVLARWGLSYKFQPRYDPDRLVCVLHHADGYDDDTTEVRMVTDQSARMNAIQVGGSALTYAERYALCAALGIAPEEDTDAQNGTIPPAEDAGMLTATAFLQHLEEVPCPNCKKTGFLKTKFTGRIYCSKRDGGCGREFGADELLDPNGVPYGL
jgi:hypothetical protein